MTASIHPTAVIEEGATIGADCQIGPFCVVGADVTLGASVTLKPHAVVAGWTELGPGCTVWPFACVGEAPQDLKYRGERTRLIVGARARIREGATLNTGTEGGGGVTKVGDDCLFMTGAHVGHDCQLGDRVIMANGSALGGHCEIGDDVIIGGMAGVHQFARIGRGAILGGVSRIAHDVIPFGLVQGPDGVLEGLNLIGLKRRGMDRADIHALRAAFRTLAEGDGAFIERAKGLEDAESEAVREMAAFILSGSSRSFVTPG